MAGYGFLWKHQGEFAPTSMQPSLRKSSPGHRDPLPIGVSCRFIASLPGMREGAHHAENLPRP